MVKNNEDLEDRFFYRLVKVLYIFTFGLCVLFILFILYISYPVNTIDNRSSIIICNDGNRYSLERSGLELDSETRKFSNYNDTEARKWCKNKHFDPTGAVPVTESHFDPATAVPTNDTQLDNKKSEAEQKVDWEKFVLKENYNVEISYFPRDWVRYSSILLRSFVFLLFAYVMLNIIREMLIYLAFGRKFTWDWLTCFLRIFKN